jgi:ParB-like chromosome segregation protein Spo0J
MRLPSAAQHDGAGAAVSGTSAPGAQSEVGGPIMQLENHPLAGIFPMMDEKTFADLLGDIRENGLREPIVVHEGNILDGRNRYRACADLGIEPMTQVWNGEGDPLDYVVSKNLHRRHLSASQAAMVGNKIAELKQGARTDLGQICPKSRAEVAKRLNISERSIKSAKVVADRGIPELVAAIEAGQVSVSAASEIAKLSKPRQAEVVANGTKKIQAVAKNIRRRRPARHRNGEAAAHVESEHDRDLRLIRNIWEGTCQSAQAEFLRGEESESSTSPNTTPSIDAGAEIEPVVSAKTVEDEIAESEDDLEEYRDLIQALFEVPPPKSMRQFSLTLALIELS